MSERDFRERLRERFRESRNFREDEEDRLLRKLIQKKINLTESEIELVRSCEAKGLVKIISPQKMQELKGVVKEVNGELERLEEEYRKNRIEEYKTFLRIGQLSKLNSNWFHRVFSRKKTLEKEVREYEELNVKSETLRSTLRSLINAAIKSRTLIEEDYGMEDYSMSRNYASYLMENVSFPFNFPFCHWYSACHSETQEGFIIWTKKGYDRIYPPPLGGVGGMGGRYTEHERGPDDDYEYDPTRNR